MKVAGKKIQKGARKVAAEVSEVEQAGRGGGKPTLPVK